ncbi:MBL fold metallo-hydrolase [Blautia obeum]|uniref:MBL fold metallo-hydrolase n=1 Tax=Blautia obeum TaxID=40520 RepID=UPI00319DEA04
MRVISTGSTKGNCYALQSSTGEIVLLDCGCKYKKILRGIDYQINNVEAVLLSHGHGDHTEAFKEIMDAGIQIYTNDETMEYLKIITGELMKGVPERHPFRVGSFNVIPFNLPHTTYDKDTKQLVPCPNYGYLVEHNEMGKLLYMTDFEYCIYSFHKMKIAHLVIECNYCEELVDKTEANYSHRLKGHCSLSTCKQFIRQNRTESLRTVTLVHLSGQASDARKIQKEIQEVVGDNVLVQIGRAGLEVDLNLCPF